MQRFAEFCLPAGNCRVMFSRAKKTAKCLKTVIKFKKIERSLPDAEPVRAGRKKYERRIHQSCCMFTESCACRPESQRRCYNCRAAPRRGTRGSACRISRACNDGYTCGDLFMHELLLDSVETELLRIARETANLRLAAS